MQTRTLGSWQLTNMQLAPSIEGKVVRMVPFGAFVELEPGVDGLVHISQIANKHVVKPEDELKVGEIINVKVLEVNSDQEKNQPFQETGRCSCGRSSRSRIIPCAKAPIVA